ncbi:hypothetical protein GGI23_004628 [Coemansia sp. RSA 2559]|nr:hypothetical protein GGI23_004628 [Coemansia sp. RSA 2559]KAJ2859215.1 hypothetical protein GGI22_003060 [Coemansia erecta]
MTLAKTRPRAKTRSSLRQPRQEGSPANDKDNNDAATGPLTQSPEAEQQGDMRLSVDTSKITKQPSHLLGKRNISSAGTAPSSAVTVVPKSSIPATNLDPKLSTGKANAATQQQQSATAPSRPLLATADLTLNQIISEYGERTDLLRLVLAAKTEEDRAKAEYERRLQEEMRFETRRLEFEMMLHDNYFKQQEQQQKQQQQQMAHHHPPMPPHAATGHIHRNDMVAHSPIGPPQQMHYVPAHHKQPPPPQHQQHAASNMHIGPHAQNGTYVVPLASRAAPHEPQNMRAYHHPDTPGGPDAQHSGQNPFAFFKMPLGTQIQHPSAMYEKHAPRYTEPFPGGVTPQETAASRPGGTNGPSKTRASPPHHGHQTGRQKRTVPPAVSGLSLRIGSGMSDGDSPRSAPVDGPNQKRKISHDEVIMALRRKVMGKNGGGAQTQPQAHQQPQHQQHKHVPVLRPVPPNAKAAQSGASRRFAEEHGAMRRSSLANSTHIDSPDCVQDDVPIPSSSSSSTTSEDLPLSKEDEEEEAEEGAEVSALRSLVSTETVGEDRCASKKSSSTARRKKQDNPHRASSIAHIMDG